jgi:hypothetical protein
MVVATAFRRTASEATTHGTGRPLLQFAVAGERVHQHLAHMLGHASGGLGAHVGKVGINADFRMLFCTLTHILYLTQPDAA